MASVIVPGFFTILILLLLFGWIGFVGVVRAEFLRARNFDYVRAARALGVNDLTIIFRHVLPNAMVATLTFLPFSLLGGITSLTGLDYLGFGLPPGSPSLGALLAQDQWAPEMFTPADIVALEGQWEWLNHVVERAKAGGPEGMIDDDLAYVKPWGFDPVDVTAPTLLIHGARDRVVPPQHSRRLQDRIDMAELWLEPEDSHVSILRLADEALDWMMRKSTHA
jgi:hypothetical protein